MESRRRLGVLVLTVVAVLLVQRPDDLVVDEPRQAVGPPVYAVLVEPGRHLEPWGHRRRPVVAASDALAKVIRLHVGGFLPVVVAAPLPVDLVGGVGHQHGRGDDACPGGGLHYYIGAAVQEVTGRPDVRCIEAFLDWEDTAVLAVCTEGRIVCDGPAVFWDFLGGELGEVGANG